MANVSEFIDEPDSIRNEAVDNGLLMTDNQTIDTREKLEADIAETIDFWGAAYPDARVRTVLRWLDRQAAITERKWMEIVDASASANIELKRQIDELQAKLNERENELGKALNEVAEKWAIEQVEAENCTKRCTMLEELVRDMWSEMITCPDYATSPCMTNRICERVRKIL